MIATSRFTATTQYHDVRIHRGEFRIKLRIEQDDLVRIVEPQTRITVD